MHVLIVCKYEKDQMKNNGENGMTSFSPLYAMGLFSDAQGRQLSSPWLDLAEFLTHSSSYVYHPYLRV